MATLEELTTPLTRAEVQASIYAAIEARGTNTSSWKPGAVARAIITAVALILSALSYLTAAIAKSGFLELSSGKWLTIVARHVYGVERITGTFAEGDVVLNNTGGGVYNVAIGDLIVRHNTTGKTYRNTAAFTLGALETDVIVPVQAIEIGSASSADLGTITEFETPLAGVTVNNPAAILGFDGESDEQLKTRCRAKLGTLSPNGAPDAYAFTALSAKTDSGSSAGATRVATVADGSGGVTVYVAGPAGALSGSSGDTSTPFGAVEDAILKAVVPQSITATVTNATEIEISPVVDVWVRAESGKTSGQVQAAVAQAVGLWLLEQPIGGSRKTAGQGYVFADALEAEIAAAVGSDDLIDVELTTPAADVLVDPDEVPTVGTVTVNVTLVAI